MEAAVLKVLVQAKGISAVTKDLRDVDDGLKRTAGQANKATRDLEDAGKRGSKSLGGLKKAAGLLGGVAVGAGLAKGMRLAVDEFEEARKVGALTTNVIKSTGGAAKITAKQVGDLAMSISNKVGMDDEAIQSGANLLLTFKNIRNETGKGRDIFNQATAAAVDLSAAGFGSLESTSKQLGKALNDPIKGMTALGRSGVTFSEDQKKAIEALLATGKAADRVSAQQIILKEVQSQVGGAAAAQATPMDRLRVTMGNLAEAAGAVLVPAMDKVAQFLSKFVGGMIESRGAGGAMIDTFKVIGGVLGTVGGAVAGVVRWFAEHRTVTLALAGAASVLIAAWAGFAIVAGITSMIRGLATVFWALNAAMVANPIGLVVAALAALVAGVVIAYRESETFRKVIDAAFAGVVKAFGWVMTAAQNVFGWLKANWPMVLAILTGPIGLAVLAIVRNWDTIRNATSSAVNFVKGAVSAGWEAVRAATSSVWAAISGALSTAWGAIRSAATTAWNAVGSAILTPVRAARDAIGDVVGGIANRIEAGWATITKGIGQFAGNAKDAIVDAFKGAANQVIGFVNTIIDVINKIPGVDIGKIAKIADDAGGGGRGKGGPNGTGRLARGGAFGMTGGLVNHPITLMGEEAPRHPEFVIPTNPAYRGRAQMLLGQAAGAIGLAEGGVVSAFRGAIKQSDAGPKPSLALWMAGIVESGLRNLTYGDRDSLGALQVRAGIHGSDLAMDPRRSALAFLNRGFTGRGGAIALADSYSSAGQLAQAVQGSAFPDRYDAVRDQAAEYLKGGSGGIGGLLGKIGGVVGDLLSKGAGFLLDKLPGVGGLPDWLQGMGTHVLGKAGAWMKDQVAGLISSGGGGQGGAGTMSGTNAKAAKLASMFGATITSGYRDAARNAAAGGVAGSSHMKGSPSNPGAHDFVPASQGLLNEALKMGAKWVDNHDFGSGLHSHVSWFAKGGQYGQFMGGLPYGGSFANGGVVPGPMGAPRAIIAHGGENVTAAGQRAGVTVMGDLVVQDRGDADTLAARLAWLIDNG